MPDFQLNLDKHQLNRLFPFHFVLNRELAFGNCGSSVMKWIGLKQGDSFHKKFSLVSPEPASVDFDSLASLAQQQIILETTDKKNRWIGQIEYYQNPDQLLFIGNPAISSIDELLAKKLSSKDFPAGDQFADLLEFRQTQKDLVTERKKIEEQLVLNEKRYRDLYNYSQALICTHDLNGKLLSVNPAICETLGYSSEEMIGKLITDFLPPENSELFREFYLDIVIKEGKSKGVFPILNKQKEKLSLLYQNFKVQEEGKESYIIGFSQDITDRVKTEEALRIAKDEVENASMAKQIFLANMSHEIRTPMNGILGIGNLLYKTHLTPKQKQFTKLIIESGNNLLHIVNDILDLTKIQSGQFILESTPFDLADKIVSTMQAFHFKAEDKGIELVFDNKLKKDQIVEGDPYRLGQVLSNLLSNALKFTTNGQVTVSAAQLSDKGKNVFFEIRVSDTGMGISQENLATIFEQFVQASPDITRKYGGTGLGLSICKNLIEMQGGTILVESEVNKGSAFTVRIPYKLSSESILKKELRKSGGLKSMARKKILVAEDVPVNQLIAKHILKSWGHVVSVAENGKEVLKMLDKNNYDLILMDIHMPEMNGVVTTKTIRKLSNPRKANIPIIAVTAAAFRDETERYLKSGMNEFITKPYTEEKLFEVIKRVLKMEAPDKKTGEDNENASAGREKLYDLSTLLSFGDNDPNFIKDIITLFVTNGRKDIELLKAAIEANELQDIFQVAHRMKSSLHTMGVSSIEATIKRLNECSRNNIDTHEIPALFAEVEHVTTIVFEQLLHDYNIVC